MMISFSSRLMWLKALSHKDRVSFALFCAKQAARISGIEKEFQEAIDVVERWLEGKADIGECYDYFIPLRTHTYTGGAINRAANAAYYMLYAVFEGDRASATIALVASENAVYHTGEKMQMEFLYELIYMDEIFEKNVLIGD